MTSEHVDVVVVGAGISGIGAAYHLQTMCPGRTYAVLEGREQLGGTWDLFRYPGVRSDSDMHTLGFRFKPWKADQAIADGPSILAYLQETVRENGIDRHIRFQRRVTAAAWSSEDARWTVSVTAVDTGETSEMTCNFVFMCPGYYSYGEGHLPAFPGRDDFRGTIVHPQFWPEDLAYEGQRVVVIGSGATAMTLVPAMAQTAEHVTMVQRSPTYVVSRPDTDAIANRLRKVLPAGAAYAVTRWKNVKLQQFIYGQSRTKPEKMKARLIDMVRKELGPDFDVDTHFTPRYDPWDQRLCLVPNSDLFEALRSGKASVVTDHIDTFTETGLRLQSGTEIEADIIVTATGLELVTLGEVAFTVDGDAVDFADTWTCKGCAYSDVPNLVSSFGYINASWTLRADLTCEYVCRVLNHMAETGSSIATPRLRPSDEDMTPRPWIEGFSAGYLQRVLPLLPKQGDREPWLNPQSYVKDKKMFRKAPIDDGVMQFTTRRVRARAGSAAD